MTQTTLRFQEQQQLTLCTLNGICNYTSTGY